MPRAHPPTMTQPRIVEAGLDGSSRSTITGDRPAPARRLPTGYELTELWQTERLLPSLDAGPVSGGLFPGLNGVRLWRLQIPPDDPSRPSAFHATATTDMGFVLQGRVTLELEDGSTADLVAGDAFVQQRSNHRWINAGSEAAVLGVIVVGTGNCA